MAKMYENFEEPCYYGFTHVCTEDKRWETVIAVENYLNKFQKPEKWR
jgi:hypothetical protein